MGRGRPARALVAEDDANMRALVADLLRKEGLEVEEVPDGQRLSTRLAQGAPIDLVVSDVRMPFMSGLDVLQMVHLSPRPTPVLLMTAFGEPGLSARVEALGGRLLDKPFTPRALRQSVRELLARGPMRAP